MEFQSFPRKTFAPPYLGGESSVSPCLGGKSTVLLYKPGVQKPSFREVLSVYLAGVSSYRIRLGTGSHCLEILRILDEFQHKHCDDREESS